MSEAAMVYHCPIKACGWSHVEKVVPVDARVLASVFGYGTMQAVAQKQRQDRVERALKDHFATHKPLEWIGEINRLKGIIASHEVEA